MGPEAGPTQSILDKVERETTFSKWQLTFYHKQTQLEFDQSIETRRYVVLALWLGCSLVLTALSILTDNVSLTRWLVRAVHMGGLAISTFGIRRSTWVQSHITGIVAGHFMFGMFAMAMYVVVLERKVDPATLSPGYIYMMFISAQCLMMCWSFVLHIPFLCIVISQAVLWICNYRISLVLQHTPGAASRGTGTLLGIGAVCFCVAGGCIWMMMANTLQLFIERKLVVARDKMNYEREMEYRRRHVAQTLHDIGTPLTVLSFGNQIFRATAGMPQELEEVVETQAVAIQMMTLTRRKAIDYAKLAEEGRLRPQLGMVDLRDVVLNKCRRIMTGFNNSHQVTLICRVQDDISPQIISDGDWVWEMVINLASNARKFTHEGTIETVVRLAPRVQPDNPDSTPDQARPARPPKLGSVPTGARSATSATRDIVIEVVDTGIGVPPEHVHKLFLPFSQLQVGAGGTGLGLYGTRVKAEYLGGTAGYRSNPAGRGSIFYFTLPYVVGGATSIDSVDWPEEGGEDEDELSQRESMRHEPMYTGLSEDLRIPDREPQRRDRDPVVCSPEDGTPSPPRVGGAFVPPKGLPPSRPVEEGRAHIGRGDDPDTPGSRPCDQSPSPSACGAPQFQSSVEDTALSSPSMQDARPSSSQEPPASGAPSPEVLVVDDDGLSRRLMAHMLRGMGCTVQTAADGGEALSKMKAGLYALVLLDLGLPIMGGQQVLTRFRAWEREQGKSGPPSERHQHQVVLVLSGAILESERQGAMDAGADGWLSKPVTLGEFRGAIGKYIGLALPAPRPPPPLSPTTSTPSPTQPPHPLETQQAEQGATTVSPKFRPIETDNSEAPLGESRIARASSAAGAANSVCSPNPAAVSRKRGPPPDGPRVLLVEDEKTIAKLVSHMLETHGYRVTWAVNGLEGLDKMIAERWHTVLTDLNMPILDGFEMTRRLRKWEAERAAEPQDDTASEDTAERNMSSAGSLQPQPQRQFIAALSACSMREDMELAHQAGIDVFLTKPVHVKVLTHVLQTHTAPG